MGWFEYREYVPVAKKKEKAEKELAKLRKNNADLSPVIIEGKKIAKTWWGNAWCENLESYADFSNRIGRGSAYVKNGFVIDLKIYEGLVTGMVMGTHLYKIKIEIDLLDEKRKKDIIGVVGRRIDSVSDLADGKFPEDLGALFLTQNKGLFPSPGEIHMDCSCPDWADMCKHVAAVLYGVGARLDQDPLLFFKLRGVDVNAFIKASIEEKISSLMKNAEKKTKRVIKEADISEIFGV
jgi:uncharacterized Zn finger protein